MSKLMNIQEIQNIIPHRHSFLLIDAVDYLELNEKIIARKSVTYNEPFFQGHFPNDPVMPGVLIIEALAQAGAVLILSMEEFKNKTAYLASIDKTRFYKKVMPGVSLVLEVEIVKKRNNIVKCYGEAFIDGERCVEADFACAVN